MGSGQYKKQTTVCLISDLALRVNFPGTFQMPGPSAAPSTRRGEHGPGFAGPRAPDLG
jgi:hypothetical protein